MKKLLLLLMLLFAMTQPALADPLTLPAGLTEIEDYAFYNCTELTGGLVIPDTVTSIGAHAFDGCTGLSGTVVLPHNVEVDETAFLNTSLELMTQDEYAQSMLAYDIADGEAVIKYCLQNPVHNLVIPSHIEGCPVTAIAEQAFLSVELTGTLTLPGTLKRIGESAFSGRTGLTGNLFIPSSVEEIGRNAFNSCTGFDGTLTLSENIRIVGDYAFAYSGLHGTFTIPEDIKYWGDGVFLDSQIKEVWTHFHLHYEIADGEVTITRFQGIADGSEAVPATIEGYPVTKIGYAAYAWQETNLTGELVLPDTIRVIGDHAFTFCKGLTGDLVMPASLEIVEADAFFSCTGLDGSIVLNEGLVSIGSHAFYECRNLTGPLVLPSTLRTMERGAFRWCYGLSGNLIIPPGLTYIDDEAFEGVGFTGTLTLPDTLTHIGHHAFYGCGFQGSLKFPASLKYIGKWAFGWTGFSGSLTLPPVIEHIGDYAFEATMLTGEVTVPASVTYLGYSPFHSWPGMTVTYECELKPQLDISLSTALEMEIIGFNNQPVHNLQLPTEHDGMPVKGVGFCAFFSCDQITGELVIPEGYEYLDVQAFSNCTGLTGVPQLPSTLRQINSRAFQNCTGMSGTLVLADNVTYYDDSFENCGLTVIMNGVVIYEPSPAE